MPRHKEVGRNEVGGIQAFNILTLFQVRGLARTEDGIFAEETTETLPPAVHLGPLVRHPSAYLRRRIVYAAKKGEILVQPSGKNRTRKSQKRPRSINPGKNPIRACPRALPAGRPAATRRRIQSRRGSVSFGIDSAAGFPAGREAVSKTMIRILSRKKQQEDESDGTISGAARTLMSLWINLEEKQTAGQLAAHTVANIPPFFWN